MVESTARLLGDLTGLITHQPAPFGGSATSTAAITQLCGDGKSPEKTGIWGSFTPL